MQMAHILEGLGVVHGETGRLDDAEAEVHQAVKWYRKIQESFPTNAHHGHALASAYAHHGNILVRLGRYGKAEDAFTAALPFQEKFVAASGLGRNCEELAILSGSLAWVRLRQPGASKDIHGLLPLLQRAREMAPSGEQYRAALLGLAHYRLGKSQQGLAVLQQAGLDLPTGQECRWTTDDNVYRQAGQDQERAAPALCAFVLAMIYHCRGQIEDAKASYHRGLEFSRPERQVPASQVRELQTIAAEAAALLGTSSRLPGRDTKTRR
jgi:tetratricopeptide (TPR) repeat protein